MKKLLTLVIILLTGSYSYSQCSDLFISEYIEGSSSNKAIEIYNPTSAAINLSDYVLYRYGNGSAFATDSLFFTGNLQPDSVYVIANSSSIAAILAASDTTHTVMLYNGDDAMWIKKISTGDTLDIIGEIGVDPGSGWIVGTGATNNFTLIRKATVKQGSTDWTIGNTEWNVFPIDMLDSLGSHSMISCCSSSSASIPVAACDSYTSPSGKYVWSSPNTYMDTIPNAANCDSIITINLTINSSSSSTITETACDSYTSPSGKYVWSSSNTYMDTIPNATNCDSIITINLTINNSSSSTITETACDSYTSPSGKYVWTSSNTYMDTILNAANCDSIITINLTINNSSSSTITETACDSYTSPGGKYVWTSSNTYMDTIPNATNCDSVITINLTVNKVDTSVNQTGIILTADNTRNGVTYQWVDCSNGYTTITDDTNRVFTAPANGSFAVVINENGCVDTSSCYTVVNVGIIENDFGKELLLYPNPTQGVFSVDLGTSYRNISIKMTDLSGKLIHDETYEEDQLLHLKIEKPMGIYLLIIESGTKKAVIRLLKE